LLINRASEDPRFRDHPGLHLYGIESYIAVPLRRRDGSYFGTLCALDPAPAQLSEADFEIFELLSNLIAFELEADEQQRRREADLRALEDFIAIAAHDLKQPLTILQGRAQVLERKMRRGVPADQLLSGATEIVGQAKRAVQLSDAVLDVARIQTGDLILRRAMFDLHGLISQCVADMHAVACQHHVELHAAAPLPVHGDEQRIGQVLRNLLDNAVKYVPPDRGPITVAAEAGRSDDQRGVVLIRVCDHGDGVADADLPRLFERKYRVSSASTAGKSGSGLGLYIAQEIVEAHGGRIWAENRPGGGLVISLTLPAAAA
jgi:signal transduction histidine kinase